MENQTHSVPRIGEKAPAFTASTTQGPIRFPDDFKGKWVLLFSHPADGVTCHDWFFCTRKLTEEEQQEMAIG